MCFYNANSGQLLTLAVTFSAALAQGMDQSELAKLGAFFNIVGDTLALYALGPDQTNTSAAQAEAVTSAINLGGNL